MDFLTDTVTVGQPLLGQPAVTPDGRLTDRAFGQPTRREAHWGEWPAAYEGFDESGIERRLIPRSWMDWSASPQHVLPLNGRTEPDERTSGTGTGAPRQLPSRSP